MVEPIFNYIQSAIQKELLKARSSIKVAVAWFTHDLTYCILLEKLEDGVTVELILNDDDINRNSLNHLDFDKFVRNGGIIHWASEKLMHTKFCIIDDKVLLEGSANWTYGSNNNAETENIYRDEPTILAKYIKLFEELVNKFPTNSVQQITSLSLDPEKSTKNMSISQRHQANEIAKKWKK